MPRSLFILTFALISSTVSFAGVTVSSPAPNASVGSPTQFVASASETHPVVAMQVYSDNKLVYTNSSNTLNTGVALAAGTHYIVVKAWDSTGAAFTAPGFNINVTSSGTAPTSGNGVTVSSPTANAAVGAPTQFVASASGVHPIVAMQVYADNNLVYTNSSSSINTGVNLSSGTHYIVVKAWDSTGANFSAPGFNISVGSSGGSSTAETIENIQNMGGWQSCDTCAGPGGKGNPDVHWIAQHISNPSLDGMAAEFYLGATTNGWHNYSNALFFNRLTPNTKANNFMLDFYVYVKDPTVIQGLEMDIFYARGGKKNYFLTECDSRGTYKGTWQVSNAVADKWQHTGLPCNLQAYSWNHVNLEFSRNSDGSTHFISVSMNGNKQYVNLNYAAGSVSGSDSEMNAAIQLDGDEKQDPIAIWVDKMTLSAW